VIAAALAMALVADVASAPPVQGDCGGPVDWPHWHTYVERFVERSGRVVDRGTGFTTSEGQAYALFMALVANDRELFDRLLGWTRDNLAGGDLGRHLPAWKWGRGRKGWAALDRNSASDADLWLGYVLLEAGRLWAEPAYTTLARDLLRLVVRREIAALPDLGPMVLPGPAGFEVEKGKAWRLNPSYLPPSLLRGLSSAAVPGPWEEVLRSSLRAVRETAPRGLVADWVVYRAGSGFGSDPVQGTVGSYDAIRSYLWAGMLHPEDADRMALLEATAGMLEQWRATGELPERIDVVSARPLGRRAPVGFAAALLPSAITTGDHDAVRALEDRVASAYADGLYGEPPTYYDQNLVLFGKGFGEGRFWFGPDGRLGTAWREQCDRP
jgi:endoglucanase